MGYRYGTKDDYERETDEAERLVRPAPKIKPKRTDKQRNTVREPDPDLDAKDPDLSMNYKTIGGSVIGTRVLARFLQADLDRTNDRVKVRHKQTGNITYVLPETLKKDRGTTYEPVDDDDEDDASEHERNLSPEDREELDFVRDFYHDMMEDPNFAKAVTQLLDPNSSWVKEVPDKTPLSQISDLSRNKALLQRFKTVGELRNYQIDPKLEKLVQGEDPNDFDWEERNPSQEKPKKEPEAYKDESSEFPKEEKNPSREFPKEEKKQPSLEGVHPKDQEEFESWVKGQGYKDPNFQEWVKDQDHVRTKGDSTFFLDSARQKMVPFEELGPKDQYQWKAQFDKEYASTTAVSAIKDLAQEKPEVDKLLRELTDHDSKRSQSLLKSMKKDPLRAIPELEGVELPDSIHTVEDLISAAQNIYKDEPKKPKEKKPEVSQGEKDRAAMHIVDNFPPDVAEVLLDQDLHPNDVAELVKSYRLAASGSRSTEEILSVLGGKYQTDPSKVKETPKFGESLSGKEVPFEELGAEEQESTMRKYRMRTVGLSLAARGLFIRDKAKTGASPELLGALADFSLSKPEGETPEARNQRAQEVSKSTYSQVLKRGMALEVSDESARWGGPEQPEQPLDTEHDAAPQKEMSPAKIRQLLNSLNDDPSAQQVAIGYLQAIDYTAARQKFLLDEGDDQISELQSPQQIWSGVKKAMSFFESRSENYPDTLEWVNDPGKDFRNRVLDKMRTLAPEKYPFIKKRADEYDFEEYRQKSKTWEKLFSEKSPYRVQGLVPPSKPMEPLSSIGVKTQRKDRDSLFDEHRRQTGLADSEGRGKQASVIRRANLRFSSYSSDLSMVQKGKTAVYWGVDPVKGYESVGEYPKWEQDGKHDLTDGEIIKAAKEWLSVPVLRKPFEDVTASLQVKTALDLALRGNKVSSQAYSRLLVRLSHEMRIACEGGCNCCGGTSNESVQASTGDYRPMKASVRIRQFASRCANENPTLAYDLIELAESVDADMVTAAPAEPVASAPVQAGEVPPQFLENMKKKEDGAEDKKDEGQAKEASTSAYASLKSTVIKMASANPHLREAYLPILKAIKQLG